MFLGKYNEISNKNQVFKVNNQNINIYIKNYIKEGLNLVQIGNKYGCSNKIIHKFIKKHKNEK
jgi:predicted aldo/keto reductase-like oxidoreductase